MGDMSESGTVLSGWSWEDNKLFELALAALNERSPYLWKEVASMMGGRKSAEEVENHYKALLEDLASIESGGLDHELAEEQGCAHVHWTDEDQQQLVKMKIN